MVYTNKIEAFFLNVILRITFVGVAVITLSDFLFRSAKETENTTHVVDIALLLCVGAAVILNYNKKYKAAVIATTAFPLLALFYSSIYIPNSDSAMIAILTVGFVVSILLDGLSKKLMHIYITIGLGVVFYFQFKDPILFEKKDENEIITSFIIFAIVYFIITYSASALKERYDTINLELSYKNQELEQKGKVLEQRNKELIASENRMNEINAHLEQIVEERTNNVKDKNAYLIKYAFANAHHVRGPLARILGLLQLSKLEQPVDHQFIFEKIEKEAGEIDEVLKTINKELEEGQDIFF